MKRLSVLFKYVPTSIYVVCMRLDVLYACVSLYMNGMDSIHHTLYLAALCVFGCMYIYVHIYVHENIHTCTCIYIHVKRYTIVYTYKHVNILMLVYTPFTVLQPKDYTIASKSRTSRNTNRPIYVRSVHLDILYACVCVFSYMNGTDSVHHTLYLAALVSLRV